MPKPRNHPRRHNYNDPGHAHALTFSCYNGYPFLESERTCQWLADSVEDARTIFGFALLAYVFMPDHAHLLVLPLTADYDISRIRHAIKSPVARRAVRFLEETAPEWLPKITRERGGRTERLFWQSGGGYDRNVFEPSTLMTEIEYIHMNPVRAGLAGRPEGWKWSSAKWFLGKGESPVVPDRIPIGWAL